MPTLTETLHTWQNFYLLAGGASATLIGLLFVALSLGSHLVTDDSQIHIDHYVSPVLLYFVSVLITAGFMLVPEAPVLLWVAGLGGLGLFGLWQVRGIFFFMRRPNHTVSLLHWFTHVIFPGGSYFLLGLAALGLAVGGTVLPLLGIAFGAGILLVSGVWHSWDLILWVSHQRRPGAP